MEFAFKSKKIVTILKQKNLLFLQVMAVKITKNDNRVKWWSFNKLFLLLSAKIIRTVFYLVLFKKTKQKKNKKKKQ